VLDANTLIYAFSTRPQHRAVLDQFNQHDPRYLFLSSFTLAELRFGVEQNQRRDSTQVKLNRVIAALGVAPFEERAARAYGSMRAQLQADGTPMPARHAHRGAHAEPRHDPGHQ
jgi:tRNA(fMet)-specific endonuclease VapC